MVQSDTLGADPLITADLAVSDYGYSTYADTNEMLSSPGMPWVDWDGYNTFSYYYQKLREAELEK